MKKRKLSVVAAILSVCTMFCATGCQDEAKTPPSYGSDTQYQFDYWGSGPSDGIYRDKGVEYYAGKDFRTVEDFQVFKDAGFNILHLGSHVRADNVSSKEEFDAANLAALQAANQVGFDQIVISDWRVSSNLSKQAGGIIGRGKMFADEAALDAYISKCISWYKDIPGVNAFNIGDEPKWVDLEAFGQVYRSIGRVWPEAERFWNLFPCFTYLGGNSELSIGPTTVKEGQTVFEACREQYERYLNKALDCMGDVDYLRFDAYPLTGSGVNNSYIATLQIAAKICKQRGIELQVYSQACEMYKGSTLAIRKIDSIADARWINNINIGFGTRSMGFFTYITSDNSNGETFVDGSSFITYKHEKTKVYDIWSSLMHANQDFAPISFNFDYRGSRTYKSDADSRYDHSHVNAADNSHVLKKITDVQIDKGCAVVTESYDVETRNYMYMIMNAIDPAIKGSPAYQTATVTFDERYTHLLVYKNASGTPTIVELDEDHKVVIEQTAGEAWFVIPY